MDYWISGNTPEAPDAFTNNPIIHYPISVAGSSNRRTAPFEGVDAGAIPAPAANFNLRFWICDLRAAGQLARVNRHLKIVNSKRPVVK